jgi:transposase InsO family protein
MSRTVWEGGDEKGLSFQHLVSALLHVEGGIRNRADLHLAGCLPYLWRSVKYEEVYIKDYQSVSDAVRNLHTYFMFYNQERLHQALDYQTPAQVYLKR